MTREQLKEFVKRMTETSGLSEEQLAEKINDAFDNKSKPSLPSDLDEAAEKYATETVGEDSEGNEITQVIKEEVWAFKAGAEWMAGQGITVRKTIGKIHDGANQIPTYCNGFEVTELDIPFLNSKDCGYGNEVIVQIRKK